MGYQEIGFSTGVVLYVVEKIVDPLAKLQHGFAAFISADKILLIFTEDITVSWCGFIFSKVLFLQSWLHSCGNAGHLGNVFRGICRAHQGRIKDLIDSQVFLRDLASQIDRLLSFYRYTPGPFFYVLLKRNGSTLYFITVFF